MVVNALMGKMILLVHVQKVMLEKIVT